MRYKSFLIFIFILMLYAKTIISASDVPVKIETDPPGAEFYIDMIKIGITPVEFEFPAGKYKIKLKGDFFEEIEDELEVKEGGTEKKYFLNDNRATITVNTFESAGLTINGESFEPNKPFKIPAQTVTVRVEMPKAEPLEKKLIVKKNEIVELDMFPDTDAGGIQIAVLPPDALIEVTSDDGKKLSSTGSKAFRGILEGNYHIKITKEGYIRQVFDVELKTGAVEKLSVTLREGIDVNDDFVFVKGGSMWMGDKTRTYSSISQREVTVTDFFIGKKEVTQKLYAAVMGKNPAYGEINEADPVSYISWYEAVEFCNAYSEKQGLEKCYKISKGLFSTRVECDFSANGYRLPTEAEWEFAARGGNKSKGFKYSGSDRYQDLSTAGKMPNELGIYDMTGSLREWCWDWHASHDERFPNGLTDPQGPDKGEDKVARGGFSSESSDDLLVQRRNCFDPQHHYPVTGFRLVRRP